MNFILSRPSPSKKKLVLLVSVAELPERSTPTFAGTHQVTQSQRELLLFTLVLVT